MFCELRSVDHEGYRRHNPPNKLLQILQARIFVAIACYIRSHLDSTLMAELALFETRERNIADLHRIVAFIPIEDHLIELVGLYFGFDDPVNQNFED